MSNIQGVGASGNVNRLQPAKPAPQPAESASPQRAGDRVDLSPDLKVAMMSKLKANDVRLDKVQDVRAQIEAGTYETDAKLDGAIDRLLDELA